MLPQGQVEYEMPLLAPPPTTNSNDQRKGGADLADRLELEDETPELPEEKADKPEFVHIATKRRCEGERERALSLAELGLNQSQHKLHNRQVSGNDTCFGTQEPFQEKFTHLKEFTRGTW